MIYQLPALSAADEFVLVLIHEQRMQLYYYVKHDPTPKASSFGGTLSLAQFRDRTALRDTMRRSIRQLQSSMMRSQRSLMKKPPAP